jgi:PAS domain S-box-containing protein
LVLREEPIQFDEDSIPFGDTLRPSASIMSVPIRHASSIIGLLSIQSYTPHNYDGAALDDLEALADHCGEALNRIRAEEELRESEERFRQLSEAAFEAIILHENGTILEVNQSFCRMYGYERAEVIGKSVLDLALPEFRELLMKIVRSGDTGPYESPALRKDGTVFKAEVAGKPISYQGRVARVAAIRDITERKRNERRQAAQYAVTRVLAESATLADAIPKLLRVICESLRWKLGEFWRLCDSTNLLRCVETWHVPALDATSFIEASRQTELAPGVGLPGRVWQSGQPEWIPDVMTDPCFARAVIAAKVGLRGAVAFPILLGNHALGVMLFFSRRAPEADEDLLKMMSAIGSQIGQFTERKRAEEALLASERKYRDIFTFAPVGIYQSLRDGTLITANHTLAEMLGYASVDELLRVKLGRDVCLVDGERETLIREHEDRGYPVDLELQWKTKDGSPIWVQLTAHAIKGANGATEYWEGFVRDITKLKRAEGALRQTEQQYESLVHSIDGIVWEADPRTFSFTFVSKQAERLLGYPLAQWLNEPNFWAGHIHPDDREWAVDFCLKATARKEDHQLEYRMIAADGRAVWLKDNVTVSIMDDESVRLRGVMVDITERKQAEEALRESEERYRELFENAKDATYVHDLSGRYTSANRAAEKLTGYTRAEILGKSFIHFVPPEQIENIREHLCRKLVDDGETTYEAEVVTKDGRRVAVEVSSHLIYEEGVPVAVQGTARNIVERKRAEAALRESEERFAKAFHASPAALSIALLEDARLLEVNDAFLRMTGYKRDEVIGRSTLELGLWLDSNQRITMDGLLRERGTVTDLEIIFRKKSGKVRNGLLSVDLIELSGKPCVLGIAQDITERKRAEAALRNYSRLLIEAQEAERQNIARELHDQIGQVLTAIRISLETIRDSSNRAESNALIDEGVTIVDEAIQQVRDLSFELRPSLLDDLGLTAALRWYADRFAQRTGIHTKTSICPESRIRLPRELETASFRIVQEALTNVARHAQAKNVSIGVRTTNGDLSLSIKDDGIGFNLHSQTNGELLSSLGLRGMEERAQGLGGKLEIKSAPREGTEVRVHFPNGNKRKELT